MPNANASAAEDLQGTTSVSTEIIRSQLIHGTYTWPIVSSEVGTIRSRGRYPSWTAWRATENAPVITAWDAITVAAVARNTSGQRPQVGTRRKNGLLMFVESSRISAPWPR